jgi:Holliday junction resolvasome RuvABC endonuclease subunit
MIMATRQFVPVSEIRVLAIDPISRGFGYAVLEGPHRLIDWGVVHVHTDKHRGSLRRIDELISRYQPQTIVVEDLNARGARRSGRVRRLLDGVRRLSDSRSCTYRLVAQRQVKRVIGQSERTTKYEIAQTLARMFPEIAPRLPKPRKPWMSEDERMAIFDALAFGLTCLRSMR